MFNILLVVLIATACIWVQFILLPVIFFSYNTSTSEKLSISVDSFHI